MNRHLCWAVALLSTATPTRAELSWERISGAMDRFVGVESWCIVGSGAALSLAASGIEDPEAATRFLRDPALGSIADVGNRYGENTTVGGGIAALWLSATVAGAPRVANAAEDMLLSVAIAGTASTVLKVTSARTRPDGGPYSFPSGHTTIAAALAPVIGHHFGRWAAAPAYVLPVMTAAGRIRDRRHHLSDVIFGYAIGIAAGRAVTAGDDSGGLRFTAAPGLVIAHVRFY